MDDEMKEKRRKAKKSKDTKKGIERVWDRRWTN